MEFVLILHNLVKWFILFFGFATLLNALGGVFKHRAYTVSDNKSNLFLMICCDIQLLLGLILYVGNGWVGKLKDLGNNMKDPATRFFTMEHTTMMLLAIILVHIGRSQVKKAGTDAAKHKKMLIFSGLALLLILAAIPWPFREALGKPWFRWF